ncbi:MAG: YggS family pyridoxal phosphate-dependent enzyme [Bacteroidales bacterium]|jgi:pyridoxal phosphate enzyme (YggS family)|nr:YggS family pyridoxal phosphate-dependent enzyme [Bacteroidales bacterium]
MIKENILKIKEGLPSGTQLVAVSKFHGVEAIMEAYGAGQRLFGENRPQELAEKVPQLPSDIKWHFIGHLQTNKLKMVLPYADMVQSIDSVHLLDAVNAWCVREGKVQEILLELHLGAELTKHGLTEEEIISIVETTDKYPGVRICGLMGMATNTEDEAVIRNDFSRIASLFDRIKKTYPWLASFKELSIGMSEDYQIALQYGATFVRIGTSIFGPREY